MYCAPLPAPFTCELELKDGRAVVRPAGEVDIGTGRTVQKRLRDATASGADEVVLDLRGVDFIGSTGLRIVLAWAAEARRDGLSFSIVRGPRPIQRVFDLTGVSDRLPFVDG